MNKPGEPKRHTSKKQQIVNRRRFVAEAYLNGKTQAVIAEELGVTQATVSLDLKAIQEEWTRSTLIDFNEQKGAQLAKIDEIERAAWEGWNRSVKAAVTKTKERVLAVPPPKDDDQSAPSRKKGVVPLVPVKVTENKKLVGQAGDPRFLERVSWCVEQRSKLLGLYPKEEKPQTNVYVIPWEQVSAGPEPHERLEEQIRQAALPARTGTIIHEPVQEKA
jgi:predicted transcriptional regulator